MMPTTMRRCRSVPPSRCWRCGGLWWHNELHEQTWHTCVSCGYEFTPAHADPTLYANLKAECWEDGKREGRVILPEFSERALRHLSEIKVRMMTPDESAAFDGSGAHPLFRKPKGEAE